MASSKQDREIALGDWASQVLNRRIELRPASDDASFRRYFRGDAGDRSYIFVDAPPDLEDSKPFVEIAALLRGGGINAPDVIADDLTLGFMMLSDFGDALYEGALLAGDGARIDALYADALDVLYRIQRIEAELPAYDEGRLRDEMSLFTDWFLPRQLQIEVSVAEQALIEDVMTRLVASATEQPQAFVHRDYHCRNLMIVGDANPGVIDFQDAVIGPVTYDLVSLLRDCYFRFDADFIDRHVEAFRIGAGLGHVDPTTFRRWFDWMGMQRHLKVAGIFSRLNLRDGKPRYLSDIPLVVDYLSEVAARYPELADFANWIDARIKPRMPELLAA